MRYAVVYAALAAGVSAHGTVVLMRGENGVEMPGLTIAENTPRDCSSNRCGSQADTGIIRDNEIREGKTGPLGRTQGQGNVNAEEAIARFMGRSNDIPQNSASSGVGVEDNLSQLQGMAPQRRGILDQLTGAVGGAGGGDLLGGLTGGAAGGKGAAAGDKGDKAGGKAGGMLGALGGLGGMLGALGGLGGMLGDGLGALTGGVTGSGGTKKNYPKEDIVSRTAGMGAKVGMPTCSDSIEMTYRQINQDGAGSLSMDCDPTSCGTEEAAMQSVEMTKNVPGLVLGLSTATNTEFNISGTMANGMVCSATCGGAENVCVCRVRNSTPAGPFGGSVACVQTTQARKRAIAYRLKKRFQINRADEPAAEKRFRISADEDAAALVAADAEEAAEDEAIS